ncbi:MAG: ASPIC/UnbV domain-containing protein, partial [Dehalococcoidia bacterium]
LYRTVGSGGSFGGAPLRQENGLGDARAVTWVEVFWPASGETQRVVGLQPRRRYLIREGTREASELVWPASTRTANAPR